MATSTTKTNKPLNPRGNDQSPLAFNRAKLYSGKALDFDGVNDYVSVADNANLSFGNGTTDSPFSITGYFNLDTLGTNKTIASKDNGSQREYALFVTNNNKLRLFLKNNGGSQQQSIDSDLVLEAGKWYFVAATYDGRGGSTAYQGLNIYVNAQLTGVDSNIANTYTAMANTTADFAVGVYAATYMNGQISNIKVFGSELTAAQVADLYNNPEKVVPTGVSNTALKLWLPMMEGAGTTAYDGSSTENGPNLIVNGDFATDSDWTKGTGWTIANGVASHNSSLGPGDLYQDFSLTIGKSYKITIEITATDTTELYFMTDNGDYVEVTGSPIGVHSHVFVADESSHRVGVRGSGNWDGSVDNITLEELNFANHGTISGATYVNGVGAPVSQSAVMNWNKGTNLLTYSENMVTGWTLQNVGASVNALESPDGLTTATKFTATAADTFHINNFTYASAPAGIWKESVFAKKGEVDFAFLVIRVNGGTDRYGVKFDLTDGTFVDDITSGSPTNTGYEITDAGNGWYKCTIQALHTSGAVFNVFGPNIAGNLVDINGSHLGDGTSGMYFWGASLHLSTAGDSYVRTEASTQPNPVLLPQGLTTGRDITGVNLFENVRKQGALNLDGNSWAEVHDNASVDIGDFSLEMWVNINGFTGTYQTFFAKGDSPSDRSYELYLEGTEDKFGTNIFGTAVNFLTTNPVAKTWYHIVSTFDDSSNTWTAYLNGSQNTTSIVAQAQNNTDAPIIIGAWQTKTQFNTNGQIAQPRIYNRALTAEEVQRNYNAGKNTYTN